MSPTKSNRTAATDSSAPTTTSTSAHSPPPTPSTSEQQAGAEMKPPPPHTLQDLRQDKTLWFKLHVFIYDLRAFRTNTQSREHLDSITSPDYLGLSYFTEDEATLLRTAIISSTSSPTETLQDKLTAFFEEKLQKRLQGRMKETGDYKVCAAHDLVPIFEKALKVGAADLSKNKAFVKLLGKGGCLEGRWEEVNIWDKFGKFRLWTW